MADMMMPGAVAPETPPPSMDQLAAFEQMRQQISPTEVNRELLATAEQADPIAVAEFKRELADLNVAPEVLDMLNTMVDEILANPGDYPAIREKYLGMGVDEELLPETFDAAIFAALNMALDELRGPGTMAPPQGFARGGIASLRPLAREMAAAGRYGDTMIAHISPIEAQILRRYGGSGTINPQTGAPEFFLKNVFKKIGKAVKKFASSTVGKIVVGTALFMLAGPAAASMLGATAGGAVAAGISGFVSGAGTTLLAGGNLKDALKAGAIGGVTAGVAKGAMNRFNAPAPSAEGATTRPATVSTAEGITRAPLEGAVAAPAAPSMPTVAAPTSPIATPASGGFRVDLPQIPAGIESLAAPSPTLIDRIAGAPRAIWEKISPAAIKEANPQAGILRQYGPLAATGVGIMALAGAGEEEQQTVPEGFEDFARGISPGAQLLAQQPQRYGLNFGGIQTLATPENYNPYTFYSTPRRAAKGGSMDKHFPRKTGPINGPGTGTSDSIPAMLSDGEFVFTAKAVRGMGNGSRRAGAKKMYALMKKLEGRQNG